MTSNNYALPIINGLTRSQAFYSLEQLEDVIEEESKKQNTSEQQKSNQINYKEKQNERLC